MRDIATPTSPTPTNEPAIPAHGDHDDAMMGSGGRGVSGREEGGARPVDVDMRGKCREMSALPVEQDPSLTLVRGWYDDPVWGRQEHWWTKRPDGEIVDPTSEQFPVGGITALYEEFGGLYPCEQCGVPVPEAELYEGRTCSGQCYGRMVGIY